jgi:hypothetical protein
MNFPCIISSIVPKHVQLTKIIIIKTGILYGNSWSFVKATDMESEKSAKTRP